MSDFGLVCLQVTLPWNFCCLDYGSMIISGINVGYGVLGLIALIFFWTPSSLNTLDFHPLNLLKKNHYPFFFFLQKTPQLFEVVKQTEPSTVTRGSQKGALYRVLVLSEWS